MINPCSNSKAKLVLDVAAENTSESGGEFWANEGLEKKNASNAQKHSCAQSGARPLADFFMASPILTVLFYPFHRKVFDAAVERARWAQANAVARSSTGGILNVTL